jgi:hypothetical protein
MTNRMTHSFPSIDQYFWPNVQDIPFTFPSSPAPSNCSSGPPQMQLDLYDPTSTSFYQNSFKEFEVYNPHCANASAPSGQGDVWNALSQLYSANPRLPGRSAGQTPPGQQFVFGDTQPESHFPFDIDSLLLSPTVYKNHNLAPTAPNSVRGPPAPPRFLPQAYPPLHKPDVCPTEQPA